MQRMVINTATVNLYDELSSQIESNMYHCKTAISYNKLFYLSTTCKVNNNNAISESYTVSTHHFHIARDPVPTSWCGLTAGHRTPGIVRMTIKYLQVWFQNKPKTRWEIHLECKYIYNICVYVYFPTAVVKHNSVVPGILSIFVCIFHL